MDTIVQPAAQQPSPPAPPRRRTFRRVVITLLVLANLIVFGGLGLAWYVGDRMDRVPVDGLTAGAGPVNYLIVGSDSRENLPDDLEGSFGDFGGARADVIMIAHAAGGELQLLSLPRDLKVEIPGSGINKINAAYAFGGPALLVETVTAATGLPIAHYLEVDFAGFAEIVDALGGIELDFPYAARDKKSGLSVEAGTTRVNGATALAYARSRSYQERRDGDWVSVDADDIGRTHRQQEVIGAILDKARSVRGVIGLPGTALAVGSHLTVEEGFSPIDLLRAGWDFRGAAAGFAPVTLPVRISNEGGVSYVVPKEPAATAVLDAFRAGDPLPSVDD